MTGFWAKISSRADLLLAARLLAQYPAGCFAKPRNSRIQCMFDPRLAVGYVSCHCVITTVPSHVTSMRLLGRKGSAQNHADLLPAADLAHHLWRPDRSHSIGTDLSLGGRCRREERIR